VKQIRGKWYVVRKTAKIGVLFLTTYHVSRTTVYASQAQLKEGNRQFKNGHYEQALQLYEDALIDTPYSSILHFNAGDAQALMGDLPKAETSFMESAKSANPLLKGASHYNRGNTLFYERKWPEAIEAYKDSLRANPRDEDAKYNLGVALRALNNPPPPKSGQGQGQQKEGKGGGAANENKDKKDGQGGEQPKPGEMSKEDAERLLAAAGSGEKKKSNQRMPKGEVPHPDEDW
jgi:Ca-activated chloride channel homolog